MLKPVAMFERVVSATGLSSLLLLCRVRLHKSELRQLY